MMKLCIQRSCSFSPKLAALARRFIELGDLSHFGNCMSTGEIVEFRQDLHSLDRSKKKEAVKKVIAAMTVGKDVSILFPDVVNCMQVRKASELSFPGRRKVMHSRQQWKNLDFNVSMLERQQTQMSSNSVLGCHLYALESSHANQTPRLPACGRAIFTGSCAAQTDDLELKKLVYLYLINYAKTQPDLAIMGVNTFVKVDLPHDISILYSSRATLVES